MMRLVTLEVCATFVLIALVFGFLLGAFVILCLQKKSDTESEKYNCFNEEEEEAFK